MNLVLLSFIALLLLCVLVGYKRGFIKSVLSFAGIVVAIILVQSVLFGPHTESAAINISFFVHSSVLLILQIRKN